MPKKKQKSNASQEGDIIGPSQKGDILTLWKANAIVFISSFCVMVIELIAGRILAPYIGVSLYTWTTIIGVILAGIALGNYTGGKIADKYHSPLILVAIFFAGGLLTIAIPQITWLVGNPAWYRDMPIMVSFTLRTAYIFFLPAFILSMVSPFVIKLTLADLGRAGRVVGTIYAISTVGSILGTFTTGFFFILLFGIRTLVWLVGGVLILTGILSLFAWKTPNRWKFSFRNVSTWIVTLIVLLVFILAFGPGKKESLWRAGPYNKAERLWRAGTYNKESNYYTIIIETLPGDENIRVLSLDHLVHSYVDLNNPLYLKYDYLKIFSEMLNYVSAGNEAPKVLHLGGGGYSFPRYLEAVYPRSLNQVVEIDPAVTLAAQEKLGLTPGTGIQTFNVDGRLFLTQRISNDKYDFVIGDVFNDAVTPYHLTTLEFDRLVKANMQNKGVYLINTIDDFQQGKYLPAVIHTLRNVFGHVYLIGVSENWETTQFNTFVIAATDLGIDLSAYRAFVTEGGKKASGYIYDEAKLEKYLAVRKPILLTDDYAPTDILLAPVVRPYAKN